MVLLTVVVAVVTSSVVTLLPLVRMPLMLAMPLLMSASAEVEYWLTSLPVVIFSRVLS